ISHGQQVRRYSGALIDAGLLPLFSVQPLLGRMFSAADDQAGAAPSLLIGEHTWRNDFAADPDILGRVVRANGEPATIIGVLPGSFTYPRDQQAWMPRRVSADDGLAVEVTARLAPGVSLAQARTQLLALTSTLSGELAGSRDGGMLNVIPLQHRFVNQTTRQALWMVFAAGLLVLLLACVNVANLQLAAMLPRRRELAVRSALGAGRRHLLGDLLAEALVMAAIATVLAAVGNDLLGRFYSARMVESGMNIPFFIDFGYDWRDVLFVPVLALASCLLAGLIPALRAAGTDAREAMADGARGSQGGFFARVSRWLVVGQIALTVVLLVGAAMFVHGSIGMLGFDTGSRVDGRQVLTARVGLFDAGYPTDADRIAYFEQVRERLSAQPQVLAASVGNAIPGWSNGGVKDIVAQGAQKPAGGHDTAYVAQVDDAFAQVYGLRLLEGRFFDGRDQPDSLPVAVIDARAAQRLWPDGRALGQRLVLDPEEDPPQVRTVVGIVDKLHLTPVENRARPTVLFPFRQVPSRFATIAIRSHGDAAGLSPLLAATLRQIDPDTPAYWLQTQEQTVRQGRVGSVILTEVFVGVGLLALLLAAAGLYGVLAFFVEQRTREIGIRRAIGSDRVGVVGLVFRRLSGHLLAGLGIGVAIALPWSALLANPSFNTRAYDPLIFASTIALVLAVAVVSALVPLRRALRVDPVTALRHG
ncbi:MAG: FtsX-like permease family protein, partial [Lysobacterales bacterium]